jgi:hypothetical protein
MRTFQISIRPLLRVISAIGVSAVLIMLMHSACTKTPSQESTDKLPENFPSSEREEEPTYSYFIDEESIQE